MSQAQTVTASPVLDLRALGGRTIAQALEEVTGDRVLLIAPPEILTFDLLESITDAAQRHGLRCGILPEQPRDGSAVPRPVAHGLVEPGPVAHGLAAPGGDRGTDLTVLDDGSVDLAELRRPWRILTLVGHGDGDHLNLGGVALCGARGRESLGGRPLPGGCDAIARRCKKAQDGIGKVVWCGELDCDLLVLLSCNSVSLAGQIYPGSNSLALAALETGAATAVIGSTRQMPYSTKQLEEIREAVRGAATAGAAVQAMNRDRDPLADGAFILLGDPDLPLPHSPGARTAPALPGLPRERFEDLVEATIDAERFETAVRMLAARHAQPGDPLLTSLKRAETARRRLAWDAHASLLYVDTGQPRPDSAETRLRRSMEQWQEAMVELAVSGLLSESHPGAGVGDLLQPALTTFLMPQRIADAPGPCPHCRGVRRRWRWSPRCGGPPAGGRIREECGACGVGADAPATFADRIPRLSAPGAAWKGAPFELRLDYRAAGQTSPVVVIQLRDKSRRLPEPEQVLSLPPDAHSHALPATIPATAGTDLHSARAVVLDAGRVSFARCLFAVIDGEAAGRGKQPDSRDLNKEPRPR